jgi:CRISPR-associated endonuclease/helicase Cas3
VRPYYAHSLPGEPPEKWEPLYTGDGSGHLEKVAALAAEFAAKFGAAEWGRVAGLWHDLGKYSSKFQDMLLESNGFDAHLETQPGRVDHSTAGAQHASQNCGSTSASVGDLIAYCIAGHHAGLPDRVADSGQTGLDCRLKRAIPGWSAAPANLLRPVELPRPQFTLDRDQAVACFQLAFFTRLVFSCLVDADILATEQFMSPDRVALRPTAHPAISQLRACLDDHLAKLADGSGRSGINEQRSRILDVCRLAARRDPGLFSLTVPTGGGKTLSSLAFALSHSELYGMERVICAIPFTSIIDQTADTYRNAFAPLGADVVLEHHSNVDPDSKHETPQSRLAAENWDAPIVVTTNVQFFESLFAAQTSRCRKLHRIVRTVIILDEAQTLPVELLQPCLAVLRELTRNYGCSVVLCTATQPALERRENFPIGLEGVREIMREPEKLYLKMKRADARYVGGWNDEQLCRELAAQQQVLCIVNTRPHAARVFEMVRGATSGGEGTFHLSTFMCGAHRSDVIATIRTRLTENKPCRVVSTQLIEAGVDIDFPVVFRALTGVDSIAQAAGRCNREGRREWGQVHVFEPTQVRLQGYLASTAQSAAELIPDATDLLDPAVVRRYFELHYWKQERDLCWDNGRVMDCFPTPINRLFFQFRTASNAFRFIEDVGRPVFVPYGRKGEQLIEQLRKHEPRERGGTRSTLRNLLRRLQRYTVHIYEPAFNSMIGRDIEHLELGYDVLINEDCYDERLGIRGERASSHEPDSLIC